MSSVGSTKNLRMFSRKPAGDIRLREARSKQNKGRGEFAGFYSPIHQRNTIRQKLDSHQSTVFAVEHNPQIDDDDPHLPIPTPNSKRHNPNPHHPQHHHRNSTEQITTSSRKDRGERSKREKENSVVQPE